MLLMGSQIAGRQGRFARSVPVIPASQDPPSPVDLQLHGYDGLARNLVVRVLRQGKLRRHGRTHDHVTAARIGILAQVPYEEPERFFCGTGVPNVLVDGLERALVHEDVIGPRGRVLLRRGNGLPVDAAQQRPGLPNVVGSGLKLLVARDSPLRGFWSLALIFVHSLSTRRRSARIRLAGRPIAAPASKRPAVPEKVAIRAQ